MTTTTTMTAFGPFGWAAPPTTERAMNATDPRPTDRLLRGKRTVLFSPGDYVTAPFAAGGTAMGSQTITPIQLTPTHRETYVQDPLFALRRTPYGDALAPAAARTGEILRSTRAKAVAGRPAIAATEVDRESRGLGDPSVARRAPHGRSLIARSPTRDDVGGTPQRGTTGLDPALHLKRTPVVTRLIDPSIILSQLSTNPFVTPTDPAKNPRFAPPSTALPYRRGHRRVTR